MIDDVAASLQKLIAPLVDPALVTFDPPSDEWIGKSRPARLSLSLTSITAHRDAQDADYDDIRNDDRRVVARRRPARRFLCNYLVTAWAASTADEHRMLATLLDMVVEHSAIPDECRVGRLVDEHESVRIDVAPLEGEPAPAAHDLCSSLGIALRPSFVLVLTVPVRPPIVTEIGPPVERLDLGAESLTGGAAAASATLPHDRKWTAFRVRESPDDADLAFVVARGTIVRPPDSEAPAPDPPVRSGRSSPCTPRRGSGSSGAAAT